MDTSFAKIGLRPITLPGFGNGPSFSGVIEGALGFDHIAPRYTVKLSGCGKQDKINDKWTTASDVVSIPPLSTGSCFFFVVGPGSSPYPLSQLKLSY